MDTQEKIQCKFDEDISDFLTAHLFDLGWEDDYQFRAYTEMVYWVAGQHEQFRFCKNYKGKAWYDMCLINYWNEEKERCEQRAARLLTLVIFDTKVNIVVTFSICGGVLVRATGICEEIGEEICPPIQTRTASGNIAFVVCGISTGSRE